MFPLTVPLSDAFSLALDDELDNGQLEYITHMRQIWRPEQPAKIAIPHTWIEKDDDYKADAFGLGVRAISSITFGILKDVVSPLSQGDLDEISCSADPLQTNADYTLTRERTYHDWYYRARAPLQAEPVSRTSHSQTRIVELMRYEGDRELEVQVLISSCLQRIPGAIVRTEPRTLFSTSTPLESVPRTIGHTALPSASTSAGANHDTTQISLNELTNTDLGIPGVTFATISQPFPSVDVKKDQRLPICFLHPALIIGTKGPVHWAHSYGKMPRPATMSECMAQSFHFAKPSLDVLLLAWHLKHQEVNEHPLTHDHQDSGPSAPQADSSLSSDNPVLAPLPPWMMVVGIIFDAQCVKLIAHFARYSPVSTTSPKLPNPLYEYRSCVIDTLPMKQEADADLKTFLVDRLRVGVALIALQRHVLRALSILDGVVWPDDVIAEEGGRLAKALGKEDGDFIDLPTREPSPSVDSNDYLWDTYELDRGESAHAGGGKPDNDKLNEYYAAKLNTKIDEWMTACK